MPPKRLFFMTFAKKAFTISSLLAVGAGLGLPVLAQNATISGAGATFPAAFYQRAFAGVADKVRVNYQSVGSGAGVRQYVAGTVDFGATDEPIKASEAAKVKRGVIQFPAVGGTIAVAYNKADCKGLKLTQKQVVQIFLGTIKTWDELKCGKGKITVAHRSDGSGTTFAFTNSLSSFSPEWKSKVGEGKSVKWPVGIGGKGNEGVAGTITCGSRALEIGPLAVRRSSKRCPEVRETASPILRRPSPLFGSSYATATTSPSTATRASPRRSP